MRKLTAIIAAGLISLCSSGVMAASYMGPISSDSQVAAAPNTATVVAQSRGGTESIRRRSQARAQSAFWQKA